MLFSAYCSTAWRFPLVVFLTLAWCADVSADPAPPSESLQSLLDIYKQAVDSPLRTATDREDDAKRKPLEFLKFTNVQPGMRVLDVAAGGGYSTQLLALAVGSKGRVWAQGSKLRPALEERLSKQPNSNIVPVVRPFDNPVPGDVPKLDLVTIIWNYHDIAYLPVDRAKMNQKLFAALKPGGHLVVIDHAAKAGSGTAASQTLHRIDEVIVKHEMQQAGFKLEEESDAFRNPADPRDQVVFNLTIPADNFALRFVKP